MRSMLTGRARIYLADAARAFERAPVEVTVVVVLAVAFSRAVEMKGDALRDWTELAVAGVLIIAVAWAGTLLHALWGGGRDAARRRWMITGVGTAVVALYAAFVLDFERTSEVWRAFTLVGAALLALIAAPVLAGPVDTAVDRVRTVAGRVLLRAFGALLYCAALFAGLALALAAINTLFELNLDSEIYAHVFGWIFLVLATWIVVGGLPEFAQPVEPRAEVAGVVHRMTAFLVPPLLVLYYAILYAYAIRIAVTGEVPKNLVSPMVLAAGLLAGVGLFLFDPQPRSDRPTTFRSLRLAPPLFLPLAALGAWTILLRVSQYGWTEFRLLRLLILVALAGLAVAATIQLLRKQRYALHVAPIVLAGVLLLAAVGPWSVIAVSRHSQQTRLDRALAAVGVDGSRVAAPAGTVTGDTAPADAARGDTAPGDTAPGDTTPGDTAPADTARTDTVPGDGATDSGAPTGENGDDARTVPAEAYDAVNATARYLGSHHGVESLPPLLASLARGERSYYDMAGQIGLRRATPIERHSRGMGAQFAPGTTVDVEGFSVRRVTSAPARVPSGDVGGVVAIQDSMQLRMQVGAEVFHADLSPLVASLAAVPDAPPTGLRAEVARLDVFDADGLRRGSLLVLDVWLQSSETAAITLQRLDGLLVLSR